MNVKRPYATDSDMPPQPGLKEPNDRDRYIEDKIELLQGRHAEAKGIADGMLKAEDVPAWK